MIYITICSGSIFKVMVSLGIKSAGLANLNEKWHNWGKNNGYVLE